MAMVTAIGLFLIGLLSSALSRVLADEFKAWTPWVVAELIQHAVAKLPENERERFEEEWKSHINEVPGDIGKLLTAIGFFSAARKITLVVREKNQRIAGRIMDVVGSLITIVLFAPVLCGLSIAVIFGFGWPILVFEKCTRPNGQTYTAIRFRSLSDSTERLPELIGSFLRRTSLEWLPVFFGVLRGEAQLADFFHLFY